MTDSQTSTKPDDAEQASHALADYIRENIRAWRSVHGATPAAEFIALVAVADEILRGEFGLKFSGLGIATGDKVQS